MAPTVQVTGLDRITALQLLAGVEKFDPAGIATLDDLARDVSRGACFAATENMSGSQVAYVLQADRGQCRVLWAQGEGPVDWSRTLLPAIELQASHMNSIYFQTARRGLVRQATRQGYQVKGWLLGKELRR